MQVQAALSELHKFFFPSQKAASQIPQPEPEIPVQKQPSLQKHQSYAGSQTVNMLFGGGGESFPGIDEIHIDYDFELFGFPKNALSLYGVDIGIFISLPEDEKGAFLNAARMSYEERCKEISPDLIQFLFDFEGQGIPSVFSLRR